MERAGRLLLAYKREETRIMNDLHNQTLTEEKATVILSEVLRRELARIIRDQDSAPLRSDAEIDDLIGDLEEQSSRLRRAARRNDFTRVEIPVVNAAAAVGTSLETPLQPSIGRRAVELAREILDIEANVLDGDDVRTAAATTVSRFSDTTVDNFVKAPVLISKAKARTLELYPSPSMKGNIEAPAKLLLEFFGDIAVSAIAEADQKAFFAWMARLPKNHGRAHGKNRFCRNAPKDPSKAQRSKAEEIAAADAADAAIMEEIRRMNHVSDIEKRALLSERLTPRITMATLKRNRDGLNRIFKAAADLGCKPAPVAISYKAVQRTVKESQPQDRLFVRVTQPKLRLPWTEERLSEFLTSPLFTGCFSEHRRWRKGRMIIRDSLYWVPLILLTIGSRIEEILLLKRKNLILRNGVFCLAIGLDPDQGGKTDDAKRIVPLPQILLDLGFVEWVQSRPESHGPLMFPEAAARTSIGDVTGPFSKSLNRILERLGLKDFDEDLYAMRKTLSSMLRAADVTDGERQAIAGHKHGSILNRHYTAHYTRKLKDAVDKVELGLRIRFDPKRGFATIASCGLAGGTVYDVDVTLNETGEAETISVSSGTTTAPAFSFSRVDQMTGERVCQKAVREAARRFRELVAASTLNLPKHHLKRLAIEHFQALA